MIPAVGRNCVNVGSLWRDGEPKQTPLLKSLGFLNLGCPMYPDVSSDLRLLLLLSRVRHNDGLLMFHDKRPSGVRLQGPT